MTVAPAALAEVARRDERSGRLLVESRHVGHVVLVVGGEVLLSAGDAALPTYVRSSVKPVQASVCLEVLAEADWPGGRPSSAEVAIGWASHDATDEQLGAVDRLCDRAGIEGRELTCPADRRPAGPADDLDRRHHNCSGKHALFALAGRALGERGSDLLAPSGQLQRRILGRLDAELGGVDAVAVDGCGAPAVRAPLVGLAGLFSRIATEPAWEAVRTAGLAHPDLVAGPGWIESCLLAGGTVAKRGAEGVYAAGWSDDRGRPVGVAVKAEDGATRGAAVVLAAIARRAGRDLTGWQPARPSGGDEVVGDVTIAPELDRALAARWR